MGSKYVVIRESSGDNIQCLRIFKSYLKALGFVYNNLMKQKKEFENEGDEFEYSDPINLENGVAINVHYNSAEWTTIEKPKTDRYLILTSYY